VPAGIITVPPEFASELHDLLEPFSKKTGVVDEAATDRMLGKAGRLMYLIPSARPWVSSLWGALAGSKASNQGQHREAPPNHHAVRRFSSSARWLRTLLKPPDPTAALLPLEQVVVEHRPDIDLEGPALHIDASPWGGGLVLHVGGKPVEYAEVRWRRRDAKKLKTSIGSPDGQTTWEYVVVLLGLLIWGSEHRETGLALLGDNLAALGGALSMKGRGSLSTVTRELAWRRVRFAWRYAAGHLPSEHNVLADALSRLHCPAGSERKEFPPQLLSLKRRAAPELREIWSC